MDNDRSISEFNGAQLKIFRIDEIIRGINMCRHNLDLINWLLYLQDFDMELESVKKVEEKEILDKELKNLSEEINKYLVMKKNSRIKSKSIPTNIIDNLNEYQKKLLIIFKASGLEMKLQGDSMSRFGK